MIQVEYKLKIGPDEFLIKAEVENEKAFFETMSFYTSLPKVGPNGETDLKLVYRNVKGYTFYSVVSEEAKMEFNLGQYKEGGGLYAKNWEPLFQKDGEEQEQPQERPASTSSRFTKEPVANKPAAEFKKPAARIAEKVAPKEEPHQEAQEEQEEQNSQTGEVEAKQAAPPVKAGGSKMSELMSKYGAPKTGAKPSANLRR